ncbi:MAG: UDP-N-acetylmuramoyl-L-alanyl-D-glutamate--2,6-diaminopimelate ligase, partial [Betaproteobacteria bacterium]|nr:UDP-N-acetylmuramoyl-L-alanyl-D-glutamate--2,6-diaminopimelate ligase [Betaproteobacteria bacterium]
MMAEVNHPFPPGRGNFKYTAAQLHSELQIKELISDSRLVKPGDTFVAYRGDRLDGREFIADALERGAQSIIWDPEGFVWPNKWQHITHRPVTHLKENISELANVVYGSPSQRMSVIGVTGTNGKSTCSQWLSQLLTKKEGSCGLMGTLGNGIWPELTESLNTTLDAIECQKWLNHFVQTQCQNCVMEVSSHGLVQGRVSGVSFTGAIFTNLTRDHLDYHGTMEAYAEAKALLFQAKGLQWAVINIDDEFGQTLVKRYRKTIPLVLGYSLKPSENEEILSASNIRLNLQGISFDLAYQGKITEVKAPILGRFNVANLMAVLGALKCLGMDIKEAITSLDALQFPKGRLEKLSSTN